MRHTTSNTIVTVVSVIFAVMLIAATTVAVAVIVSQKAVPSSGVTTTNPNIGLYSDAACTQPLTTLQWGTINAGSSTQQTIYIKNTGTGSMTLSIAVTNWAPIDANNTITITMDKTGATLTAGQSTAAILTCAVNYNLSAGFPFTNTITISGTG